MNTNNIKLNNEIQALITHNKELSGNWVGHQITMLEDNVEEIMQIANNVILKGKPIDNFNELEKNFSQIESTLNNLSQNLNPSIFNKLNKVLTDTFKRVESNLSTQTHPKDFDHLVQTLQNSIAQKTFKFSKLMEMDILDQEPITDQLSQIHVLEQTADGTTSGFENCGLHALKNACVAIAYGSGEVTSSSQFNSQEFFLKFYNTFCKPFLENSQKGKSDITMPILRDIIQHIRNVTIDDSDLKRIQKSLLEHETLSPSFLNVVNEDGLMSSKPTVAFFDEQSWGIENLVGQLKSNKPFTHIILVGNQTFGHWYTFILHQNEKKERQYLACDSINNFHSDAKNESELGLMVKLLNEEFEKPDLLMEKAVKDSTEKIEKFSNWLDEEGNIFNDPSGAQSDQLLNKSPVKLLALDHVHLGSHIELNADLCLRHFQAFKKADWLSSDDLEKRQQLLQMQKVMIALEKNMDDSMPLKQALQNSLLEVQAVLSDNDVLINKIFEQGFSDIKKFSDQMNSLQKEMAEWTFKNIKSIYDEMAKIAKVKDATSRDNLINTILKGGSAEEGLVVGHSEKEIKQSMMEKVNLLLMTYQKAVKNNQLLPFLKIFADGTDKCLNARMGRLADFAAKLSGIDVKNMVDWEKVFYMPGIAISIIIENLINDPKYGITENNFKNTPASLFQNKELQTILIKNLRNFAGDKSQFLKFLAEEKLIQEGEEVDWEKVVPNFIEHPKFNSVVKLATTFIVE